MVKTLFDTSVLIAATLPEHPKHSAARARVLEVHNSQIEGFLSNHTLAECYSVLTRMPRQPKISPISAEQLLARHLRSFTCINLTTADYQTVIAKLVSLGLPGGVIFDALIAEAVLKAGAERLLTLNPKDFRRLGTEIAQMVEEVV